MGSNPAADPGLDEGVSGGTPETAQKGFYQVEKGLREVIKRAGADPKRRPFRLHESDALE